MAEQNLTSLQNQLFTTNSYPPGSAGNFVNYWEMPPYTEAYQNADGVFEIKRTVLVDWSDRFSFRAAILGSSAVSGTTLKRFLPEQHPDPAYSFMYAQEVTWDDGIGQFERDANTNMISYVDATPVYGVTRSHGLAKGTVTYRSLPYDIVPDSIAEVNGESARFVERNMKINVESLPLAGTSFKWITGPNDPVQTPIPKTFTTAELTYTLHWWPAIPTALTNLVGQINSTVFDKNSPFAPVASAGFPVGTVLFLTGFPSRVRDADGNIVWRINCSFVYRPTKWNFFWRPSASAFQQISSDGTLSGVMPYTSADLNTIFTVT